MANYSLQNNYQSLSDLLNKEDEQLFSPTTPTSNELMTLASDLPANYNQLGQEEALNQIIPAPVVPKSSPTQNPQVSEKEISGVNDAQDSQNKSSDPSLTKSQQLIAEYQKMLGEDQQNLKEARSRDRMLKVGGALGDALATYLNAQGQMNVKAPGVEVQQGAGLGKVADMFATAPEIASDVAARREAMMKQYAELARGERAQARLQSEEKRADVADKRARELAQMQIEGELKAAGIRASGTDIAKEREERMARTAQLNAARGLLKDDPRAKKAVEQGMALESIEPLLKEIESGNEMAIQSLGTQLARAMGEVGVLTDTDVIRYVQGTSWGRKLKDWWARGAEGELPKDAIDGIRKNIKAINTNLKTNLNSVYNNAAGRMKTAYPDLDDATIRGMLGTPAFRTETPKTIDQDAKIESFMKKNNITNKDEAIKILKEHGKI